MARPIGRTSAGEAKQEPYQAPARLNAAAVVQITPVTTGLHVALHDVAKGQVVNVGEFTVPSSALGRDWRLEF